MIPALVLTAGLATRLRPLSLVRAKAALPVAGDPLIRHILRWLAAGGVTDAVLNLHHLPHTITGIVGDGARDGMHVRYSWEVPVLGSAGGPRRALPLLGASTFLIVNGDTLTDLDLSALVADHRRTGALVTMAAISNNEPDKYSGLDVDADGVFRGIVPRGSSRPSYHFIGVQVAEAEAFAPLPDNVPSESVRQRYPDLAAARRGSVRAFVTSARFHDIGTPADYLETSLLVGSRQSGVGSRALHLESRTRARIADSALIEDCVLWDDVEVEAGATLRRCVVTDGVTVPAGASWENAIIRVARGDVTEMEQIAGNLAISSIG